MADYVLNLPLVTAVRLSSSTGAVYMSGNLVVVDKLYFAGSGSNDPYMSKGAAGQVVVTAGGVNGTIGAAALGPTGATVRIQNSSGPGIPALALGGTQQMGFGSGEFATGGMSTWLQQMSSSAGYRAGFVSVSGTTTGVGLVGQNANLILSSTLGSTIAISGGLQVFNAPTGSLAAPTVGSIMWHSTTNQLVVYNGARWFPLSSGSAV